MIEWHEHQRLLKFVFPVALEAPVWTSEIPYGAVVRPLNGNELPMQSWADLSDGRRGLAVANDSKYGLDARDGALRITILRSPVYSQHDPVKPQGDERYHDQGIQDVRLLLLPHGAGGRAEVSRQADLLNCPPVISREGTHAGRLPAVSGPAVRIEGDGGVVMALKRAEDGGAWVVRAFETAGQGGSARFEIPALRRDWRATFRAGEIKTFRIPDDSSARVEETNFLEGA
jgi:alpha-mannosidase